MKNCFSSFLNISDKLFLAIALIISIPVKAFAVETNAPLIINNEPMSGSYLFQLILGLIVVLICIIVLAWFAKRMNRLQSSTGNMLKIVGGISMGARERVVLLQVGSEQLLIGVSPGRINTLHILDAPLEDKSEGSDKTFAKNLSEKLSTVLKENK